MRSELDGRAASRAERAQTTTPGRLKLSVSCSNRHRPYETNDQRTLSFFASDRSIRKQTANLSADVTAGNRSPRVQTTKQSKQDTDPMVVVNADRKRR